MKTVTAAEANRHFSQLLRVVSQGEEVLIVSRGRSVARVEAVAHSMKVGARQELLQRLQNQESAGQRNWQRADLYAR